MSPPPNTHAHTDRLKLESLYIKKLTAVIRYGKRKRPEPSQRSARAEPRKFFSKPARNPHSWTTCGSSRTRGPQDQDSQGHGHYPRVNPGCLISATWRGGRRGGGAAGVSGVWWRRGEGVAGVSQGAPTPHRRGHQHCQHTEGEGGGDYSTPTRQQNDCKCKCK